MLPAYVCVFIQMPVGMFRVGIHVWTCPSPDVAVCMQAAHSCPAHNFQQIHTHTPENRLLPTSHASTEEDQISQQGPCIPTQLLCHRAKEKKIIREGRLAHVTGVCTGTYDRSVYWYI